MIVAFAGRRIDAGKPGETAKFPLANADRVGAKWSTFWPPGGRPPWSGPERVAPTC